MPSTVEQLSPTRAKLTIEIPFSELEPAIKKAYQEIASQVSLPGFRKGKVPNSLIDQRYGRGAVLQEAINDALPQAYASAVEEHKIVPLGQPEVDVTKLEDGEVVEFTAEVDVRPEFVIPEASTVNVEVDATEVTEDEINQRVELMRQRFGTLTDVERAAEDGDYVVIDLVAYENGEPMADTDAHDMTYCLGEGGMVDGLDEALHGMSAGESKRFTTELVGGPKKGAEAEIEVTVKKVQEQELPALDDEFAQLVSEFDTVEEMLDDVRDNLVRIARIEQANIARDLVLANIVKATEFELPEALINAETEARKSLVEKQLSQAGLTVEQYLADAEEEEAETEEDFWAEIEKRTAEALRAQIILDKYADDTEVRVSQQDLSELIMQKAMQNGTTPEQEANHMVEHNHMGEWMQEIRRGKALGSLVNSAKVTDSEGNIVDLSRLQSDGTYAEEDAEQADSE